MEITWIGIVAVVAGLLLLLFKRSALFGFVVVCSLFGGASAVNLTAMGDASVPPGYFALAFLALGILGLPGAAARLQTACRAGWPFLLYAGWAIVGAFILPRLFQDTIELPPMKSSKDAGLFFAVPLGPSSRNVTQAVYITGTCAAMLMAGVAARSREDAWSGIVKTLLVCGLIHVGFGIADLVLEAVGQGGLLDVFRNGNYAQLDQAVGGFHRIAGVFSETSAFSGYGFFYFVFAAELWLRRVFPILSGLTALALGVILVFTTSTSAYIGLSAFALMLSLRILFTPHLLKARLPAMAALGLLLVGAGLMLAVAMPGFVASLWNAILAQTVNKSGGESAIERGYWARKGFEAFAVSHGMGVGVGSFRSSSFAAAVLGSMGVVGAGTFLWLALRLWMPAHRETWDVSTGDPRRDAGAAAAWAAILGLSPGLIAAASADPGLVFGLFAGLALAWRTTLPAAAALSPRRTAAWRVRTATHG